MGIELRKGSQEPTIRYTLPYQQTEGQSAIEIYEKSGREAMEWQKILIYDMMARDESGLWVHSRFGYSVPRQNGKNEIIAIRELWGLFNGEKIAHTAHRTSTSRAAWERLVHLLENMGYNERAGDFRAGKSKGQEYIYFREGMIQFRTRSSTGGLGESFDLLVIDEAQEYQDDHESALKYTIAASMNPQTILLGTPPTVYSSGTIFPKMRTDTLLGKRKNTGWCEWSIDGDVDIEDKELWYKTNPSLGTKISERTIEDELGDDKLDFQIQRLGRWIRYNQKSVISAAEWRKGNVDTLPSFTGSLFIGIKYGKDTGNVAMTVAVKTEEGKIFTETQACRKTRDGNGWILDFIKATKPKTLKVIIDGAEGQRTLETEMKEAKLPKPYLPRVAEVTTAYTQFEQTLTADALLHMDQPAVRDIVENVEKRPIGSGGGWGYRSLKVGAEVAILDSIVLAVWAAKNFKEKKVQKVRM